MQGVGMSMFPIAFSVIREQFPKSRLAIGQGVITSMFASGSILVANWRHYCGIFRMENNIPSILPVAILLPIVVWKFARIEKYILIDDDDDNDNIIVIVITSATNWIY